MKNTKIMLGLLVLLPWVLGAGCAKGGALSLGGPKDCGNDQSCFDEEFRNCSPARITNNIQAGLVRTSEIIGMKNRKCDVRSVFVENTIAPQWVGKEQICHLDNAISYIENQQEILNSGYGAQSICEGSLIDAMKQKK